jgi:phosphoribosyl 1,2-cyclic phosphodiesterase
LLASGSRGNCALVECDGCRLLIDAGLSGKETEKRLAAIGLRGEDLHAILVTHEHHDHVGGIGPLARRYDLPVHIDEKTCAALPKLGPINSLHHFTVGGSFSCRDLLISSFSTTHDAVNPVGFVIHSREGKIGFATDLGMSTRLVVEQLRECRVLVMEANHDDQMLQQGPYPWTLKQRIKSRHGHLSNHDSLSLLEQLAWSGLEAVFLAHLSEENNCPDIAQHAFQNQLARSGYGAQIILGCQHAVSPCYVTAAGQVS